MSRCVIKGMHQECRDTQQHTGDEAKHHSQEVTGQAGEVCRVTGEGGDHSTALLWCVTHDRGWDRPSSHASHPALAGHQQACKAQLAILGACTFLESSVFSRRSFCIQGTRVTAVLLQGASEAAGKVPR